MNIVFKWCSRKTPCQYCSEVISKDEPMIVFTFVKPGYKRPFYFHPQCWLDERLKVLSESKPLNGAGGRPRMELNKTQRHRRKVLINHYNRLRGDFSPSADRKRAKVIVELENLGGKPAKWG